MSDKKFAVIRDDYPEIDDVWEFDDYEEAEQRYNDVVNGKFGKTREGNRVLLVQILKSKFE